MKSLSRTRSLSCLLLVGLASAATLVACGGDDGQDGNPLLIDEAPASDECGDYDGTVVSIGYDTSGDGAVDDVQDTYTVCDGQTGPDGEPGDPGDDGEDGATIVTSVDAASPGGECAYGGQRVAFGLDHNGDGSFDEEDLLSAEYICNNTCTGEMSLELDIDPLPSTLYEGFENRVPVSTDADGLAFFAYSTEHFGGAGDMAAQLDITYDADTEELVLLPEAAGSDEADFIVLITDGCETTVENFSFNDFAEGQATTYFAHFASDTGPVTARLQGDDDDIGTIEFTDVAGPVTFDTDASYTFELLDDDGNILYTTDELDFLEPWTTKTIFAYEDDGDLVVDVHESDVANIAGDRSRFQLRHLAEGQWEDVDVLRVDDGDIDYEWADLNFPDLTPVFEFDASTSTYFALDDVGDGDPHVDFTTMAGAFAGGNAVDGYLVETDDGNRLISIDTSNGTIASHDPDLVGASAQPDLNIPDGDDFSHSLTIVGCDTVDEISMDIDLDFIFTTVWLTLRLEAPDGTEVTLWAEGSTVGGDRDTIVGNFNDTIDPDGTGSAPISDLAGVGGNGEWTLYGDNRSSTRGGTLNSWGLNFSCS